jgi:hypothetical protein
MLCLHHTWTPEGMLPLQCKAQNYAWGKLGSSSKVAELQVRGGFSPGAQILLVGSAVKGRLPVTADI